MHARNGITVAIFAALGLICIGCDGSSSDGNRISQPLRKDQELKEWLAHR